MQKFSGIISSIFSVFSRGTSIFIPQNLCSSTYLLDQDGHPTAQGVAGEMYIGGMGLARGYRQRPALTAATFVPDPFGAEPGARLYKAGDVGQLLPDGNIAFLGRRDHQVKIRGYRLELGEIEAVLARYPAVAQAAAMALATSDDKRLVGYVVAKPAHTLELQDLQRYMRQQLPAYMIPSQLVVLEHMPLTSSGKIDRLRLPAPPQRDGQAGMPPRNERERQLASIWEELLDVSQPGLQDDFFTLGGHSILAIRLLARIRDTFGTELPLAALLQAPTIQGLAEILQGDQQVRDFTHLVALQKGTKRPFFCVPGVGGTVFYLLKLASLLGRDQPFYGLQGRGLDGETLPYSSVEDMAKHYVQAIRTVQPQGPYWLGGHSFGGHVAFEIGRQLQAMGHEIGALVLIDCPAPAALSLHRTWDVSALFLAFATMLGIGIQDNPTLMCQMLGDLDTDAKLALLYEEVLNLDAFPLHVDMGKFHGLFQVYLLSSMMQYAPEGRLDNISITLLAAQEPHSETLLAPDAFATFTNLTNDTKLLQKLTEISAAWAEYDRELRRLWATDEALGWDRFTTRSIAVRRVSGNHLNMFNEPHVQVLATVLKDVLEEHTLAAAPRPQPLAVAPYPLSKVQEGLWLLQKLYPFTGVLSSNS